MMLRALGERKGAATLLADPPPETSSKLAQQLGARIEHVDVVVVGLM